MRCFAVLGPSQTGKSTLTDRLAALEGTSKGTAANGLNTVEFTFGGEDWCGLDAPGGSESLWQAEEALLASDACILCVSPDPEAAVLAAPYLRAIDASGTPCILFINRMDEQKGRLRDVVASLQDYTRHALVLRQIPMREGDRTVGVCDLISERAWRYREGQTSSLVEIPADVREREHEAHKELLEQLSDFDDKLLEELIEDREPPSETIYAIASRVLRENRIIPVLLGAAGHSNGVLRLMKALRHEAPPVEALQTRLGQATGVAPDSLAGVSFHGYHRPNVGKTILVRAFTQGIRQGSNLGGASLGAVQDVVTGKPAADLRSGAVFAAIKSDHLPVPALLTPEAARDAPDWSRPPAPMVERILVPASERDEAKLSGTLAKLAETDRGFTVTREEGTGAQLVSVQGPMHLRDLCRTLSEIFHVEVSDRPPSPSYRETIAKSAGVHYRHKKQTGGAGQFADLRLNVHPNQRGSGFTFDETVKGGAVPRNYIPAVEAGAREAMTKGALGFPVIDVGVVLTDGQHHAVDSSDFAFRTAARMGVRQALSEAAPALMQPIFRVEIHLPSIYSGNLVQTVSGLKGQIIGFDRDETARGWDIFRAAVPWNALDELALSLRAATQGTGWFSKSFDHFEEMYGREADAVVAAHATHAAAG
jgi:elongation factor G